MRILGVSLVLVVSGVAVDGRCVRAYSLVELSKKQRMEAVLADILQLFTRFINSPGGIGKFTQHKMVERWTPLSRCCALYAVGSSAISRVRAVEQNVAA